MASWVLFCPHSPPVIWIIKTKIVDFGPSRLWSEVMSGDPAVPFAIPALQSLVNPSRAAFRAFSSVMHIGAYLYRSISLGTVTKAAKIHVTVLISAYTLNYSLYLTGVHHSIYQSHNYHLS